MSKDMKTFSRFDKDIELVTKPSDIDPLDDEPSVLRAVLSCGHVTDPQSLTDHCRAQLDDGRTEFRCPLCEEEWPYDEVRKLAKLTPEEQLSFEDTIGRNTVKKRVDFRECPGCSTFIERLNACSLCVKCTICSARTGNPFLFCWQCMREWEGAEPCADGCGNEGCSINQDR